MAEVVQDIEESPGVISMIRKLAKRAVLAGEIMIYAGIVLAVPILVLKRYEMIPVVTCLELGGPGLITAALGFKAWQRKSEEGK